MQTTTSNDQVVDLEEAVGSYLNCLSTSCAAGSKLYTSVGKLVDEKFNELFPGKETKLYFQALQTQNAFEGYQKALLECKEKLLEILIDNHTKRQPVKEKGKQSKNKSSEEEQYASVALRVAKELYCYHQTVADVLKPLHFSDCQEDLENVTLTNIDGKSDVVTAWMTIAEANKNLRAGYGLTNAELSQILSWQHGEDITESSRKKLNQQVNALIQQYVDQLFSHAICEVDVPVAYNTYPDDIQKVLQHCCSPTERHASSAQGFPVQREEMNTLLHRELPRVCLCLNGRRIEKAHPGKAYENATLKMKAVREAVSNVIETKKLDLAKEQIDMFCLRVLSIASISAANAACRTAVIMTFGKANLVQVTPIVDQEKLIYFDVNKENVEIQIQSRWAVIEDTALFTSLCRGNSHPIATIHVTYHADINIEKFLIKRTDPIPVAHITQCILQQAPTNQNRKEPGRERSKSIKIKLTKATNRLFQRKSGSKFEYEADIIMNEFAREQSDELEFSSKTASENGYNTSSDSQDDSHQPVPPPRHKRKAKKSKKSAAKEKRALEAKKEDLGWFSTSTKFAIPLVPTLSGSQDQSPSVASFEELQGVINFLSGSSTSSLAINEKGQRQSNKTHKRNSSTTSLPQNVGEGKTKTNSEGKLKLCHKKSASFSGKTTDMNNEKSNSAESALDQLKKESELMKKDSTSQKEKQQQPEDSAGSIDVDKSNAQNESPEADIPGVERTPGDGMDNKINKDLYNSSLNIGTTAAKTTTATTTAVISLNSTTANPSLKTDLSKKPTAKITTESSSTDNAAKELNTTAAKKSDAIAAKKSDTMVSLPPGFEKNEVVVTPASEILQNNNNNNTMNTLPYFGSSDIESDSKLVTLTKQFQNMDVVKSLPSNLHMEPHNSYGFQKMSNASIPSSVNSHIISNDIQSQSPAASLVLGQLPSQLPAEVQSVPDTLSNVTMDQSNYNDFADIAAAETGEQHQSQTLYEPFNSRSGWQGVGLGGNVGGGNNALGGSRFKSLWSEATLDGEKVVGDERSALVSPALSSTTSHSSGREGKMENEFTLDKQQDFHKLLEGSKFLATGYQDHGDSWKDRRYNQSNVINDFHHQPPTHNFPMPNQQFETQPPDPWPIQSNFGQQARHHHHHQKLHQQQQQPNFHHHHLPRNNIESLQLPPNPVGPYMRQNREQLLAKQQILEQFARHQKQMQIQQQQQQPFHKPSHGISSHHNTASMRSSSMRSNINNGGGMDRVSSVPPPGLGRDQMSKYDLLPDRPERNYFHRSMSQQHHRNSMGAQQFQFGGNSMSSGIPGNLPQSRSIGDIRMENTGMGVDQGFLGSNDRNPYREQFNQLQQDVFSTKY